MRSEFLRIKMTKNIKQENVFHFDNDKWQIFEYISGNPQPKIEKINLGCYNVLFPSNSYFKKIITSDIERYNYQIEQLIPEMDIDVLALSEVKDTYIQLLLKSKWIQNNYYVFNPQKVVFKQFFGNLILSKFPMICYSMDNVIYGRIAISLILPDKKPSFLILSIHLTAFENNYNIRRKQLSTILEALNSYSNTKDPYFEHFQAAVKNKNIIIMGDLNFHLKYENIFIYDYNLVDLWTETNKELDGYSWDSLKNTFINVLLPFDNRRMRLDRIMFTEGSNLFDLVPEEKMIIFGDKKVFPNKILSYLRGSDHFGLKVKISLNEKLTEKPYQRKVNLKENFDKTQGFRSERTIIFYRVLFLLLIVFLISYFLYIIFR